MKQKIDLEEKSKEKIISYNKNKHYSTLPAVISLSALFPKDIFEAYMSYSDDFAETIRNFIAYLLPKQYRTFSDRNDLIQYNDQALICFWKGNIDNDSRYDDLYNSITKNLVSTSPVSISDIHNIINELQPKLQHITQKIPATQLQAYKQEITELCKTIENERSKFSGFSSVNLYKAFPVLNENEKDNEVSFFTTLAHLVIIACTSSIWCKPESNTSADAERAARKIMPCDSTNYIELSYHDGIASLPRICWSTLFPKSLRDKTYADLTTSEWFRLFIPDEFQIKDGKRLFVTDRSETSFSNFWGGKNEGNASCKLLKKNIVQEGKKLSNKYESLIEHITHRCSDFLKKLPPENCISYQADVDYLFSMLQNNSSLLLGKKELVIPAVTSNNTPISDSIDITTQKLMYLVLIASTWTIWAKPENKREAKELSTILFPEKNEQETKDLRLDLINQSNEVATQKLQYAIDAFENSRIKECGDLCREIITYGLADDIILGDAYYYLVRCRDEFNYHYDGYYNKKEFLSRALSYGSPLARKKWSTYRLDSLRYLPKQEEELPPFRFLSNVPLNNCRIDTLLRSFSSVDSSNKTVTYIPKSEDFATYIKPELNTHILLFDEDQDKNYIDFLSILDLIKNWNTRNESNKVFTKTVWEHYRIYIRLDETKYTALVDTAIKHMDGTTIPVSIIDDNKLAAQYLLSRFPLFYPIRSLSKESLTSNDVIINLNIISESDNELTNWIIREAYWLGTFFYTGVTLSINIISPKKDAILSRLEYTCPRIFLPIPDSDKVSKVSWGDQDSLEQLESGRLFDNLNAIRKTRNGYSYYIINCDSDISSLNLAIKIREWEIQNTVRSKTAIKSSNFPVITYHCENLDICHMAESLVVHQEEYGDNWYNNYSIIPFNASHHYQFSELDGGHFEKMSQSVHLQYCGCDTNAPKEKKEQFLEDYFTRCYNRDSSMAVALSIPYRLFQMSTSTNDHILPIGWVLKNTEAYSNNTSLKAMANQATKITETNKQEMLYYERARWMRYMISRGWQPASADETIKFMKAGNPRRQLYIGLLHGCICSQTDLKELQEKLYAQYEYTANPDERFAGNSPRRDTKTKTDVFDKYLQYDIRSIQQTSDIIGAAWFPDKESYPTYFIDDER